ncbi:unnamed protein product [Leptidea sinapis]|uniref:Aminopeptidase n=1 Tax=Leptidea sinapis TaxID=189913 RepID=A0A5E4QWP3_9NEOP|nr:unnamed protein product [Leptidea sinapis]
MSIFLRLAILLAILAVVRSELPFEIDDPVFYNTINDESYRLPEDLDPLEFDVEITPYLNATTDKEALTFDGFVSMRLQALRSISTLVLHENVREILNVTLFNESGSEVELSPGNEFERDRVHHFLKINLRDGLSLTVNAIYRLVINFIGNINETPLSRGVFRGIYRGSDGREQQVFPCFDEPGFKSVFNMVINRPAHFTETYANIIGDRVREVFNPTPRMSAYLITFHISEEFTVIASNNNNTHPYQILARPNAQGQGAYALEIGPPLTTWFDQYLGIEYYKMEENMKNDQIASPDWASGATENWGLVSYRELRLLYEEGQTNALDKMYIGTITAHELAHKWFGNLITCRWWDNVWINEGFASYFEYFAMHEVDKTLELADQFIILYVQSALSADSGTSTRALQHTVNSPTQVTGHFSGISYSKGASLLLMLKQFMGESTFKKALNYFLLDRSYKYAVPSDLYNNFQKAVDEDEAIPANISIASMMQYWVEEQGYPVINVDVNMDTGLIKITQERFFISPSAAATEQNWPLPLTFTTGSSPDWDNLKATHVMLGREYEIQKEPGHEWVIFNVQQQGIYRVNYDIVDDVFALMRSGRMTYDLGFQVLDFLKKDTSYYSWYPAITGFSWLRNRFRHMPDTFREFNAILLDFVNAVVSELAYDVQDGEPLTRTLNRFYVLQFACEIGHEGCVSDAIAKFNAYKENGERLSVNPNLRRHVFCQGLLNGNYTDWRFMYNRRQASNNQGDEVAMLRALGCTTNAEDVQAVVLPAWFENVLSNLASYLDEDGLTDMEQWLRANQESVAGAATGLSAIASSRSSMQWGTDNASAVLRAARGSAAIIVPTTMLMLISVSLLLR